MLENACIDHHNMLSVFFYRGIVAFETSVLSLNEERIAAWLIAAGNYFLKKLGVQGQWNSDLVICNRLQVAS